MKFRLLAFSIGTLSVTVPAAGQRGAPLTIGERLRVRIPSRAGGPIIGTLIANVADTLVLRTADSLTSAVAPLHVSARSITRIERSTGMGHRGGRGALIGGAIGVPAGVVWGIIAHKQCETDGTCYFDSPAPEALGGAILGAGIGAAVGYVVGLTRHRERWEQVPMVIATLRDHQTGVAVRVSF